VYHPSRHHDILSIRAVDEQQIVAEIRQVSATVVTPIAGRRVVRHYPHPLPKIFNFGSDGGDRAAKLVPKHSGWGDHTGVSTLHKDFEIGAAGRRGFYTHEDVCVSESRDWDRLEGDVARSVE
jgi:hypothetical protein